MSDKLAGVHPTLVAAVPRILAAMHALGFEMLVTDGVRTVAQQLADFQKGRSDPGRIVTQADGVHVRSNHQVHADGFGHAVDLCFVVNGQPSWDEALPWRLYAEMGKALGLAAGADWKTPDKPHLELS